MAFVTGEVVADTGGESPFKVVFKQGETVLAEWSVESQQEGEEQIIAAIQGLMEEEGDEDDEEGNEGEEDGDRNGDDDDRSSSRQRR